MTLVIIEIYLWHELYHFRLFFFLQQLRWKYVHTISGPPWSKGSNSSKCFFYGTYERGLVVIYITMACDISIQCVFSPTKKMVIIKIHFGHCLGKYGPWYRITPYLLCRDRPAAALRCAYFIYVIIMSMIVRRKTIVQMETTLLFSIWEIFSKWELSLDNRKTLSAPECLSYSIQIGLFFLTFQVRTSSQTKNSTC